MATKQLAMAFTALSLWLCMAIGTSNNCLAQCENGVCKLPAQVAKAAVYSAVKPVQTVNKAVKKVAWKPFRRWRR